MVEETGAHEAEQLMRLLWRHAVPARAGGRGPKQKVSVDAVVAAAVTLADRDGYDRVSIRSVAAELGLRPMSLYTYVPSKEALAVLMVDAVADRDVPIPGTDPPRRRMGAIAGQIRDELLAHPGCSRSHRGGWCSVRAECVDTSGSLPRSTASGCRIWIWIG